MPVSFSVYVSWMNNSTWIWFLLYAHHRSKADKNPIPAIWSEWRKILLSPLDELFHGRDEEGDNEPVTLRGIATPSKSKIVSPIVACLAGVSRNPRLYPSFIQRLSLLVLQAPVLTLGFPSCHRNLLKICSLLICCLLLIPDVNLVPPFLFFLSLHIPYNHYRKPDTPIPTRRIGGILHALFLRRRPRSSDVEADASAHAPVFSTATHSAQSEAHAKPIQPHSQSLDVHTAFLVIGLQCLVVVNILFLVDVELTLSRDKHFQFDGEGLWGSGRFWPSSFFLSNARFCDFHCRY